MDLLLKYDFMSRLPLVACLFLAARMAVADNTTVSVGGTSITLPAPAGFFRYDGKSAKVDSYEQKLLPATNRLLADFGSEEDVADVLLDRLPTLERHFSAQTLRSAESLELTATAFGNMKPEIAHTVAEQASKYRDLAKNLETSASVAIGSRLTIGESIPLGVFDDTADSICFSMLSKVKVEVLSDAYVSISTCCVVRVSNRVLYLLSSSPYRDKSDIEWARRNVKLWRDAVLKANAR